MLHLRGIFLQRFSSSTPPNFIFSSSNSEMFRRTGLSRFELVKSFQASVVADALTRPQDLIIARMLPTSCTFFSWPGLSHADTAAALMSMPEDMRTCHTVFGRVGAPVHLAFDIDCPIPKEHFSLEKSRIYTKDTTCSIVSKLNNFITKEKGFKIQRQLILRSPNLKKVSIHVHIELEGAVFADYRAVGNFLHPVQDLIPQIDMNIYRNNGMLRCFAMKKPDGTCEISRLDDFPELNIGTMELSPAELLQMSFIVADVDPIVNPDKLKIIGGEAAKPMGGSSSSASYNKSNTGFPEKKWTPTPPAPEAYSRLPMIVDGLPLDMCAEYKPWITVGIMLKHLAEAFEPLLPEEKDIQAKLLQLWDDWSRKARNKYQVGGCKRRWASLNRGKQMSSDDWRVPYNYLMKRSSYEPPATKFIKAQHYKGQAPYVKSQSPPFVKTPRASPKPDLTGGASTEVKASAPKANPSPTSPSAPKPKAAETPVPRPAKTAAAQAPKATSEEEDPDVTSV